MEDALLMEKRRLEKAVHQTKKTVDFYDFKAGRIEDQVIWVAHVVSNAVIGCINGLSAAVESLLGSQAETFWR